MIEENSQRPSLHAETIQSFVIDACGGDQETVMQMVGFFLDSAANLYDQMETGLAGGDFALIRRAAHSLKSSSRMFSAETLSTLCVEMERLAEDSQREKIADSLLLIQVEVRWLEVELPPFCAALLL